MVSKWIDVVDSDSICAKFFHQRCIKLALVRVDQGIIGYKLIGNSCNSISILADISVEIHVTSADP